MTRYEKESVDQTPWIPIVDSSGETRRIVKDTPLAEGEARESDPRFRIFKYQLESAAALLSAHPSATLA